jgi:lipopolysaccharide assembly outer membrane protein LptD (OstA)
VDSVITFYSSDTTKVNIKTKKVLLIGNAQIDFKQQQLNAAMIEIDFNTSIITANFVRDSAGKPIGIPKMKDGAEEYYGESLTYNIKTNTGTIKMGETQMGEGYYFGEYISRVSKNE